MNENSTPPAPRGSTPLPTETVSPIVLLICAERGPFPKGADFVLHCAV